jgi:putative hydrolase of the HAD superfamily
MPARLDAVPGIRAVLFDVYGTMLSAGQGEVGSAGAIQAAAASAAVGAAGLRAAGDAAGARAAELLQAAIDTRHAGARRRGIEFPEVEIRRVWRDVLAALAREGRASGEPARYAATIAALEYELRANPAWPMPGLGDCVAGLAARGARLGIVSNAQFYTPILLELFEESGWSSGRFDPAISAWSYRLLEAKPSGRLIATALQGLRALHGIPADRVLYVGNDMLNDIACAAECGCRTALFAGDAKSLRLREGHPRCRGRQPDLVVTELRRLPACVAP